MRYELFIDERRVDLSDDNIALNYKSNLLSDITKIVSNNSYTIKLPKTSNNMALFGHAEMVSSSTRFPYVSHNGILFRDGIEIIRGASVVLLKIDEGIEIALVWNDTRGFNKMISEGASLRDMPTESERVVWKFYYNHENEYYPIDNYGWGLPSMGDDNYTAHPCVKVSKILSWMEAYNGVKFNIPTERQEFINSLIVPLISKDPDANINPGTKLNFKRDFESANWINLNYISYQAEGSIDEELGSMQNDGLRTSFRVAQDMDNVSLYFNIWLTIDDDIDLRDLNVRIYATNGTSPARDIYFGKALTRETSTGLSVSAGGHLSDVQLFADEYIHVGVLAPQGNYTADGYMVMELSLLPIELKKGDYFPLVKNLPDMKQVDFLKAIAQMAGMYAYPDKSGNITFVTFESLYNNKAIAQDWTDIVVEQEDELARNIEYTLNDTAQRNWYRYKEDSSYRYKTNGDAYIQVNNRTLEAEKDVVELPFAASLNDFIMAYSYKVGEESNYEGSEDRIFVMYTTEEGGYTRYYATFNSLEWGQLLFNHYAEYSKMLADTKVITEYVNLSSIDLKNVQMNVPVYLGQHGAYFAIVTIVTKENDICEVKLVKM